MNRIGEGPTSNYIRIAIADPARTLAAPVIDRSRSSKTSLFVTWTAAAANAIPVDGYRLFMIKKGGSLGYTMVYDGSLNPTTFSHEIKGLETGAYYAFYVVAVDFNSVSQPSPETVASVCLAPDHIENPFFISALRTQITLGWKEPTDYGGCPILGYELLINDGLGGELYTIVDDAEIRNKPYLSQHTVTGLSLTGNFYKFKIRAFNEIGVIISSAEAMLLAAVPDKPNTKPWQVFALTT